VVCGKAAQPVERTISVSIADRTTARVYLCREIVNVVGEYESDNPDSGGKTGSQPRAYRDFRFEGLHLTLAA